MKKLLIFPFLFVFIAIVPQIDFIQLGADIDGEAADNGSGTSVSMNANGDRLAIGAPYNDGNGVNASGHVRIFQRDTNNTTITPIGWTQLGADIDGDSVYDRSGHSVSMNANGDRVAIGAPYNDGNGLNSGHVKIYDWDGTAWTQLGAKIDGEAAEDESGTSVSMNANGDRVAIGAHYNDGNGNGAGHVRIYDWDGTTWTQLGTDIDGEAAANVSGASVSMNANGDRVAIGARQNGVGGNNVNGSLAGHVRIYQWDGTTWTQLGVDIDGEAANDVSGHSVSMNANGDRVAIGAPGSGFNGLNASGHVRIYEWDGITWTQLGADIDGAGGSSSGGSVSMNANGDRVAIGAYVNDGNNTYAGHVKIYHWDGTAWTQLGADINGEAADDYSGWSVSMNANGDRVAIGAHYNDGNGLNSGHVRIYYEHTSGGSGLSIIEKTNSVNTYPNPTNENITISIENYNGNIQIEVYNLIGNRLQTTNETTISLRDYSKGIYILKVAYGDRVEEVKVIKD
jgi:hypothetical protein